MICKGRIVHIGLVILILLLVSSDLTFAKSTINVTSNTDGGESKVKVESESNVTTTSTTEIDSQTNVKINVNGDQKEFNSTDGDVNYESEDGNVSVKIINNRPKSTPAPKTRIQTETIVIKEQEPSVKILTGEESQVLGEDTEEDNSDIPSFTWINPDIIRFLILVE